MTQVTDEFKEHVNLDLRQDSDADREWLEENLEEWKYVLTSIKVSIESQMSRFRADKAAAVLERDGDNLLQWQAEKQKWRADTLRLKASVEERLSYIKFASIESQAS